MATQTASAKAGLLAALSRSEPQAVPREVADDFFNSIERLLRRCDVDNVKTCRVWLTTHIVPSPARVGLLGKYLASVSCDIASMQQEQLSTVSRTPSIKRRQLHLLYLVNDLLHHTKFVARFNQTNNQLPHKLEPHVVKILKNAGAVDQKKNPQHIHRLSEIINVWDNKGYFKYEVTKTFREVVLEADLSAVNLASDSGVAAVSSAAAPVEAAPVPYELPATYGDFSSPPLDQPAGLLLTSIGGHRSVRVRQMTPLRFREPAVADDLVLSVKQLLTDMDDTKGPSGITADRTHGYLPLFRSDDASVLHTTLDECGQLVLATKSSGDPSADKAYYGWTVGFAQDIKDKKHKGPPLPPLEAGPPPPPSDRFGNTAPPPGPGFHNGRHLPPPPAASHGGGGSHNIGQGSWGRGNFAGAVGAGNRGGPSGWRGSHR